MINDPIPSSQPVQPVVKKKNRTWIIVGGILILCLISVCLVQLYKTGTSSIKATSQASVVAQLPVSSATSAVIMTSPVQIEATNILPPSDTPGPTSTPVPTETPQPTFTLTLLPEPVILNGKGDSVVDIEMAKIGGIGIAHIVGNKSSGFFAVTSYDAGGSQVELLVNTTDPYDGYVPLDLSDKQHTTRFEINASGDWNIELLPLQSGHELQVPGSSKGNGDEVLLLRGGTPDTARIVGNKSAGFFAIQSYGRSGYNLLVNTTDPYDGTVILSQDALILVINASGDWTIEIKSK